MAGKVRFVADATACKLQSREDEARHAGAQIDNDGFAAARREFGEMAESGAFVLKSSTRCATCLRNTCESDEPRMAP